jgi:FAD/FMN-containing dehydrogenase
MDRRAFLRSTAVYTVGATAIWSGGVPFAEASATPPDVLAITGAGREVTLSSRALAELRRRLRGRVLLSEDNGYEKARRIRMPIFDKRPALIVQVADAQDVQVAVDFAREQGGLLLAVKGGGHSFAGKSTCDLGMMIDLSLLQEVRADPARRTISVAGGALLGGVDRESMRHGLATPLGTVGSTGVGGLVTGGGFGRLSRRFGLSVDNLTAVDMVLADGRLVRATEESNPDLFWAVRGGGGNFGVVTSFDLRLHPMERQVLAGLIFFPKSVGREVLKVFEEYGSPSAPDDVYLLCMVTKAEGMVPMAGFQVCYSGPPERAEAALAPIRRIGTPLIDTLVPTDFLALQSNGETSDVRASESHRSGFVSTMPDGLISAILEYTPVPVGSLANVVLHQAGGAIARVPSGATAFPHRNSLADLMAAISWPAGADSSEHMEWLRAEWARIEPYTAGAYSNDHVVGTPAAAAALAYGDNLPRLRALKARFDPGNLFRLNTNIEPVA